MGRVISVERVGTERQQLRRTIAESLRRLMEKPELDEEAKDLAALIVFCLDAIAEGVDRSATAWERRDYYLKADRFRREWAWANRTADEMTILIQGDDWDRLPAVLGGLAPRFADVRVVKLVRPPSLWQGAYQRLLAEEAL
jgi:hypothetical protein